MGKLARQCHTYLLGDAVYLSVHWNSLFTLVFIDARRKHFNFAMFSSTCTRRCCGARWLHNTGWTLWVTIHHSHAHTRMNTFKRTLRTDSKFRERIYSELAWWSTHDIGTVTWLCGRLSSWVINNTGMQGQCSSYPWWWRHFTKIGGWWKYPRDLSIPRSLFNTVFMPCLCLQRTQVHHCQHKQ